MRISSWSRRGFGTTTTFVLVIIGIALMILLGGDLLSRGSRISIERAYATGQLLRIASMALEEATRSEAGKDKLADYMLASVAPGGNPPPKAQAQQRDDMINEFLQAITPMDSGGQTLESIFQAPPDQETVLLTPHKHPWGDANAQATGMQFWQTNGKVVFGVDSAKNVKFTPATLRTAYKKELDSRVLTISDVEMRVIAFKAGLMPNPDPSAPQGALIRRPFANSQCMGYGVARARVSVSWVMSKGPPITRTVMCDRFFELYAPAQPVSQGGTGADTEWTLIVNESEWQREAVGD